MNAEYEKLEQEVQKGHECHNLPGCGVCRLILKVGELQAEVERLRAREEATLKGDPPSHKAMEGKEEA